MRSSIKPGLYYNVEFDELYEILEVNGCYLYAFGPADIVLINMQHWQEDTNEIWIGEV